MVSAGGLAPRANRLGGRPAHSPFSIACQAAEFECPNVGEFRVVTTTDDAVATQILCARCAAAAREEAANLDGLVGQAAIPLVPQGVSGWAS